MTQLFNRQQWEIAAVTLLLQIEQRPLFLTRFGVNDVPAHGGFGVTVSLALLEPDQLCVNFGQAAAVILRWKRCSDQV